MGIRIHKIIGYGLDDLVTDEKGYYIQDPRVNPEGIIIRSLENNEFSLDAYLEHLESQNDTYLNIDRSFFKTVSDKDKWKYNPYYSFHWNGEYGIPNVICFCPITHSDWSRYDDIIDYVEATYIETPAQQNQYKILAHGIYPWDGIFMDARTGKTLPRQAVVVRRMMKTIEKLREENSDKDIEVPGLVMEGVREIGFSSYEEARDYMAPIIPESIIDLLKWGKAFTDESVVRQLRPMMYTYWS
jgi:hypothetical protein